jgi:hypothetical protein
MNDAEKFVKQVIEEAGGMVEIAEAIAAIQSYLTGTYYESKQKRLAEWTPSEEDLYKLIICVFTATLSGRYTTYQAMAGKLNKHIKMDSLIDRVKTISEVIAIISKTGLITIFRSGSGKYIMVGTEYTLGQPLPFVDKHATIYHRPQPVESNFDEEQGSMLLGGPLNHHEGFICLDHINKMNSIPLTLNKEFLVKYPEEPKKEKSVDTIKKLELWELYVTKCKHKYAHMLAGKNKCFLNHKYCTRGRTYASGYCISTQGSSYKKAMIQLANKEYLHENDCSRIP